MSEPTLFDLTAYDTPQTADHPPSWIVCYQLDGREFLLRRPKRHSEYDPIAQSFPADNPGRCKPERFKTRTGALQWAQRLQKSLLNEGKPVVYTLTVRTWHE